MMPAPKTLYARLAAIAAILPVAACGGLPPAAGSTQVPVLPPTPSPTSFSADAFLHATGPEAANYPSRYYSPEGDFSLDVPADWVFDQQADSGHELDSISERPGGQPVAAMYEMNNTGKEKTPQQVMEAFLLLPWMANRRMEILDQSEFSGASGIAGWKLTGTAVTDPEEDLREKCILIAFAGNGTGYILAAYPDRSASPVSFAVQFKTAAASWHPEEARAREVDTSQALQLARKEIGVLDPAVSVDGVEGAIGDIFSGLAALDTSLTVQPDLAERWDVSPDGRTYTFHLRENAKFHNGRPVTSEDVLFSWLRAASSELGSDAAMRFLGDIAGLRDFHAGKTDSVSGLRIVDARTLQATLDAPKPFFLEKLTAPPAWIVDRYNVRLPNWRYNPNGTGPFRVVQNVPGKNLLLETAPEYYGTPARLRYVRYFQTPTKDEALYRSGKIDRMVAPEELLPKAGDPHDPLFGNITVERRLCTDFLRVNTFLPPFDDPLVRKAFSLSVNREIYVEVTPEVGDLPGTGILPPGMTGYEPESGGPAYDPQEAKALLSRSRYYNEGQSAPEIHFLLPSKEGEFDSTMEFLIRSWERLPGVDVFVEGVAPEAYREHLKNDSPRQLIWESHCAYYPDPENFFTSLFPRDNAGMPFGYRNDSLDALLDSAAVEKDWIRRVSLYRRADQILYDDAPVIVLSYRGPDFVVWKTRVRGYVPTLIGVPQHRWMWIEQD
jgi:oligopeptide transport system substrate-binding protein